MKPIILCLTVLLLVTNNSFSQVLQKKQVTAPVLQKTEQKKASVQPKAIVTNPALKQIMKPMDTLNAKLSDVEFIMGYSTPYNKNGSRDLILTHYHPQFDLFDENNRHIAEGEITNEDYNSNDIQNQEPDKFDGSLAISLHMKLDNNTDFSLASFKKGTIKMSNVAFYNGPAKGVQDYFTIKYIKAILTFRDPSLHANISGYGNLPQHLSVELSLKHPSTAFSFHCVYVPPYLGGSFDTKPLY